MSEQPTKAPAPSNSAVARGRWNSASSITTANAIFSGGTSTDNGTYNVSGTTTVDGGIANLLGTVAGFGAINISSGTLNIASSTASAGSLTQSGGALSGSGTLTVTGLSTLSGGTESGTGTTNAQGGAAFSSTGFGLDAGRTLQLGGTSTASGTNVQINLNATSTAGSGTLTIANGATFNDQTTGGGLNISANNFGGDNGATATVNDEGTFIKSGSATTSQISTLFNNTGIVNVEAGTLELSGGLSNNGELQISGGALDVTTAISGSGSVLFSGAGTFALANLTGFSESIGGFGATNTLDLGGFNSTSGDTFTTSTSYNSTDTTLTITDTTKGTSASVTLVGNYTSAVLASQNLLWSVAIDGSGGADVTELATSGDNWNQTTGNWATVADWSTGLPGATNEAVLGGSAAYSVTSSGIVTVYTLVSTPTATLNITGGTFTVTDYAGQGPLMLSGGTLGIGSSSATIASLMQTGGTLTGTGTVTVTGSASLGTTGNYVVESGSGTTDLKGISTLIGNVGVALDGGRVLQNDGTLNWTSSAIYMGYNPLGTTVGSSTIVNSSGATFNDAVAGSISNNTGTNVFNNAGTFETTFSSGTTTIGVAFNNTGTVTVGTGDALTLSGGGASTGGSLRAAALSNSSPMAITSTRARPFRPRT